MNLQMQAPELRRSIPYMLGLMGRVAISPTIRVAPHTYEVEASNGVIMTFIGTPTHDDVPQGCLREFLLATVCYPNGNRVRDLGSLADKARMFGRPRQVFVMGAAA